jgi:hypothetical protein
LLTPKKCDRAAMVAARPSCAAAGDENAAARASTEILLIDFN